MSIAVSTSQFSFRTACLVQDKSCRTAIKTSCIVLGVITALTALFGLVWIEGNRENKTHVTSIIYAAGIFFALAGSAGHIFGKKTHRLKNKSSSLMFTKGAQGADSAKALVVRMDLERHHSLTISTREVLVDGIVRPISPAERRLIEVLIGTRTLDIQIEQCAEVPGDETVQLISDLWGCILGNGGLSGSDRRSLLCSSSSVYRGVKSFFAWET